MKKGKSMIVCTSIMSKCRQSGKAFVMAYDQSKFINQFRCQDEKNEFILVIKGEIIEVRMRRK